MKKIIYGLLIGFASALTFTACTEEEIAPSTEASGVGGTAVSDNVRE